jgi:DNA-binding HxlR family transcriptional regulator
MIGNEHNFCPVHDSIDLLQEKWVMHIVRALLEEGRGFNDLSRSVGVNAATLSQRLEKLERLGVVDKVVESTMPPRTHYSLTEAGRELQLVIDAIDTWARKHMKECTKKAELASSAP